MHFSTSVASKSFPYIGNLYLRIIEGKHMLTGWSDLPSICSSSFTNTFVVFRYTNIESEFQRISNNANSQLPKPSYAKILTNGHLMKPLIISMALMLFQQLSGINAIVFYSASVFQDAGCSLNNFLSSIIIAVVAMVFTMISVLLVGVAFIFSPVDIKLWYIYHLIFHRWTDLDVVNY